MDAEKGIERLLELARVHRAIYHVRDRDEATLQRQIELSEIPAPPFAEEARGERVAELFGATGLIDVRRDEVGNVLGLYPGSNGASGAEPALPLVISAHLDTVFPEGTDVSVRRSGDLLKGPGISDDARGLTSLVAVAEALTAADLRTRAPLLFVATVGEEGIGDLRGVKHLFGPEGRARGAEGFISLDGAGMERVVLTGLGSRRYRVTVSGPGGHSWIDWGTPNPIHTLHALGHRLSRLELKADPQTTLTIARTGGGKSINAIPQRAWMEIDTRSPDNVEVDALERRIRSTAADAAHDSGLDVEVEEIGDRPGGATDVSSTLAKAALAATRALGYEPVPALSSTDANIPMSLGVPAVTLGCGGDAGKAHTTEEWYRNDRGPDGIVRALCTVLLAADLVDETAR